jgi:hypothetical protein
MIPSHRPEHRNVQTTPIQAGLYGPANRLLLPNSRLVAVDQTGFPRGDTRKSRQFRAVKNRV